MPRILIIIIGIFLSFGLGIGLIWPKYQDLKTLEVEIFQQESELSSRKEYLTNLKNISQELEKYKDSLSKIDSALPKDHSSPSLFNFIQKASSQSGLILANVGPVIISPVADSDIKELHFWILLSGSYSALKNFLPILENSGRLIEVDSISFSSPKMNEPFSFNLDVRVHSY